MNHNRARIVGLFFACLMIVQSLSFANHAAKVTPSTLEDPKVSEKSPVDFQAPLSLGLDLGLGFNTNPYGFSNTAIEALPETRKAYSDLLLKIQPTLSIDVPNPYVAFNMDIKANMGALPDIIENGENWAFLIYNGSASGELEFNSKGPVSLVVQESISTTRRAAELFISNMTMLQNDTSIGLHARPNQGNVKLQLDADYGASYWPGPDFRWTSTNDALLGLDSRSLYGHLNVKWDFSPKGTFYVDVKGGRYQALQQEAVRSNPLWALVGLSGKLATRVSGDVHIGYANPFAYDVAKNKLLTGSVKGIVAGLSVEWNFAKQSKLSVGWEEDLKPLPIFLNAVTGTGYVRYAQSFNKKTSLNVVPMFNYTFYGLPFDAANNQLRANVAARRDLAFALHADLNYELDEHFSLNLSNQANLRWSNAQVAEVTSLDGQASAGKSYNLVYSKNETMFSVGFKY